MLVIPLIYFYPVLWGKVTLAPGDGWAQNFGVRVLAGQLLSRGELPLWNPFIFAGMPLAASVYPGVFYPPNWLFAILTPGLAMNLVVLTTYHLALIGTYLFARRAGMTRLGALLAGLAFTFGGYLINHLAHTSRIAAAAWLPWILLAVEAAARSESGKQIARWACLGGIFVALQLVAGEPQMAFFSALIVVPYSLLAIRRSRERSRFLLALGVMAGVGVLLSAVQWLPARDLLTQSERADPGPLFFDTYSLPPWQLPGLVFPYFFGGAMRGPYRLPYWGREIAAIMAGYAGMLAWLPAIGALALGKRDGRVIFWGAVAVVSLLLAFGGYLPLELNHLLYRLPGYQAFRGPYRHQFELTFALAMLAGWGMTMLAQSEREAVRRALRLAGLSVGAIVLAVAGLYLCWPAGPGRSLTDPELLVPLTCFAVSLAILLGAAKWGFASRAAMFLLPTVLLLDLAMYGHFFHWRIAEFRVEDRLPDPPAVQLIKSRESNLHDFRVMTQLTSPYDFSYAWPEDRNYDLVDQPNISLLRGLQSASGYDVLRPARFGELAGSAGASLQGFLQDPGSFLPYDRGLDLLNVKYLIVGHGGATGAMPGPTYDGIYFSLSKLPFEFKAKSNAATEAEGAPATEIAIVSSLANSAALRDGTPLLKLRLFAKDGQVIERELLAGRHTSEWAYDRPDVRPQVKHQRARVVENRVENGFPAHSYLGRLVFDHAEIERIEWQYLRDDAVLYVTRASLYDGATGRSTPLTPYVFPAERWRRLARFDRVEVLENTRVLPRAWFVERVRPMPREELLRTIRSGGEGFDPATTALIDQSEARDLAVKNYQATGARVGIARYDANRVELKIDNPGPGFLAISEIYLPGWEARIDGNPAAIHRVNHTLRGIVTPPGSHRIEMLYRPASMRLGACLFVGGLVLLAAGYVGLRGFDDSIAGMLPLFKRKDTQSK